MSTPSVLKWLLDNRPIHFIQRFTVLWQTLNFWMQRRLGVPPMGIPALCQSLPQLTATCQHHLQHLASQLDEDQAALTTASQQIRSKEEVLLKVLLGSSILLMMTGDALLQDVITDLFAGPSLLDSALILLSGLAKATHKQHVAQQQQVGVSSSANGSRTRGGIANSSSSSTGGSSGNSRGREAGSSSSANLSSSSSSSSTSGKKKKHGDGAGVVGVTSFEQLPVPPDHDLVKVSSGLPATAAQADNLVNPGGAVEWPSVAVPFEMPFADLALKMVAMYCATSHCSFAAPGHWAAAASGPVLQLLLELTALLGKEEQLNDEGLLRAWEDLSAVAILKERQAFLAARGALLLQVLWLLAEQRRQKPMAERCWIVCWPALLTSLCATAEGSNCSVQAIAGKPLTCGTACVPPMQTV